MIPLFSAKHNFFINSFFPSTVIEWNNLDLKLRNSDTFFAFKKSILKFIRPFSNSVFNSRCLNRIKLITRLSLGFSPSVSTSLGTIFRILLIQFAVVGMISRLLFITYFIVQVIYIKGGHSRTTYKVLEKTFMIKIISISQNCFYLAFLEIMMHQIHVF